MDLETRLRKDYADLPRAERDGEAGQAMLKKIKDLQSQPKNTRWVGKSAKGAIRG